MDKGVFGFILRYSKKQQILLLTMIAASLPFYYFSLDLPKDIINEAIGGREFPKAFFGRDLEQLEYLAALCLAFLSLVLVNGGFKYFINVYIGVMGERMLRRLRYALISRVMRFPLLHFRNISEGEVVSMVTAETEPLGGFVGESFALPAYQGGLLVTALFFMFVQDPILGIAAIALYPVQGWLIPKLQRRVNLLNKERIQHVRKLSERINEMVAGASEIHAHDTSQFELADFSSRLGAIFNIRYQVYRKKFFIKFLNNFLAQVTPFFFFSIGGYLVINGEISIGALVAILAAYKDLAPPWKELLNFYQRMEDARIKYTQLIERFDPPNMFSEEVLSPSAEGGDKLSGTVSAANLTLEEDERTKTLENATFSFNTSEHVALTGRAGGPKSAVAKLLARQISPTGGSLTINGKDLGRLPEHVTGRQIGYVDQDAYIRSGSIRDNLLYGLKHYPQSDAATSDDKQSRRMESELSGNSVFDIGGNWIDQRFLKGENGDALLQRAMRALAAGGLVDDVLAIGIRSSINPETSPDLAKAILKARDMIQERLNCEAFNGLVESWDSKAYNRNASVAENILFGTPIDETFDVENLGTNAVVMDVLEKVGLRQDFVEMGRAVAALMVELFRDLPPGHEFFEKFSFIEADDLPEFQIILNASANDGVAGLNEEQRERLIQLPFRLIPAQHRLGLVDDTMEIRLLEARRVFKEDLPEAMQDRISFFERHTYNPSSSLIDNALFGKIDTTRTDSAEKIQTLVTSVFDELELKLPILEAGLNSEVGIAGRRLSPAQRQKLAIARNLIKEPEMFIVNEATGVLDTATQKSVFAAIKEAMTDRGLVWVDAEITDPDQFDRMFLAEAGKVRETTASDAIEKVLPEATGIAADSGELAMDTDLLAAIPFFSGLDRSRLKLLAFTSERQVLKPMENLITQGDSGDMAFVIVDGTFSIIAETGQNRVKIDEIGRGGVIGELALLCEAPRTATVQANEKSTVLRIHKDVFIQLIKENPAVGTNLSHILATKLESMMRSMSAHYELYDPVTGLPNRNLFLDYLKTTTSADERNDQVSSLVIIDFPELDDHDQVSGDLAHQQTVLRTISERIKPTIRDVDVLGRLSGYRFGIIARGLAADQASALVGGRIREFLGGDIKLNGETVDLQGMCSVDIQLLDGDTVKLLMEQA